MVAHKKANWKHPKYTCGTNHQFGGCKGYGVNEPDIMRYVVDSLEAKFLDPKHIAQLELEAVKLEAELVAGQKQTNHLATISKLDKLIANAEINLAMIPQNRVQGILNKIADWEIEKAKTQKAILDCGVPPSEELRQTLKYINEPARTPGCSA